MALRLQEVTFGVIIIKFRPLGEGWIQCFSIFWRSWASLTACSWPSPVHFMIFVVYVVVGLTRPRNLLAFPSNNVLCSVPPFWPLMWPKHFSFFVCMILYTRFSQTIFFITSFVTFSVQEIFSILR